MTTTKVALTISTDALEQAKREVAAGRAKSLSGFVSEAVEEKIRRDELSRLLDALDARHGSPNKAARTWAKKIPKDTVPWIRESPGRERDDQVEADLGLDHRAESS